MKKEIIQELEKLNKYTEIEIRSKWFTYIFCKIFLCGLSDSVDFEHLGEEVEA